MKLPDKDWVWIIWTVAPGTFLKVNDTSFLYKNETKYYVYLGSETPI